MKFFILPDPCTKEDLNYLRMRDCLIAGDDLEDAVRRHAEALERGRGGLYGSYRVFDFSSGTLVSFNTTRKIQVTINGGLTT